MLIRLLLALSIALFGWGAQAQQTLDGVVHPSWLGSWTSVGCPTGISWCFIPWSATVPLPVTGSLSLAGTTSNAGSGVATSSTNLPTVSYNYGFNGTTWDQLQVDGSKNLKVVVGGTLPAFAANPTFLISQTDITGNGVEIAPTAAAAAGITPVVSASAESSHVLKASAGNLYGVSATNLTATGGFLVVLNSTTAPADGAITPLACVTLPASSVTSISYDPGPPAAYSTGITAVVTSAATCFTKTTGVITAFIAGAVK